MGLALGAALVRVGFTQRLTYFGRAQDAPPHPLFEPVSGAEPKPAAAYIPALQALPAGTSIVVLAVPDSALAEVAFDLSRAGAAPSGCVALHLSGAISTDVLAPLNAVGYAVGALHPLQTIADPWHSGQQLVGAAYGISGEPAALAAARRMVAALDGFPIVVPSAQRPRYHAAAVFTANYTIALISVAARMLAEIGLTRDEAVGALLPLLRGSVKNIEQIGLLGSLTGPIARGDTDTVRLHISRLSEEERLLYCGLGRELTRLAREAGLDAERADALDELFSGR